MSAVQVGLKREAVEKPPKYLGRPECEYPRCGTASVGWHQSVQLCAKHLEMAEFVEWYLKKQVFKVGQERRT